MRHRLRAVDQHRHTMGLGHNIGHWVDRAQRVGGMTDGHQTGMLVEETLHGREIEHTVVSERHRPQCGTGKLPRHDVAVMLHSRHYHLVAVALKVTPCKRAGHQVDTLGGAACEDNLMAVAGTDKGLHLTAHTLIGLRGHRSQMVGTAVDIGIAVAIVAVERFNHRQRLLRRGRIVEVHQLVPVHLRAQYEELFPYVNLCHLFYI